MYTTYIRYVDPVESTHTHTHSFIITYYILFSIFFLCLFCDNINYTTENVVHDNEFVLSHSVLHSIVMNEKEKKKYRIWLGYTATEYIKRNENYKQ